jgi:hypothetical protein
LDALVEVHGSGLVAASTAERKSSVWLRTDARVDLHASRRSSAGYYDVLAISESGLKPPPTCRLRALG